VNFIEWWAGSHSVSCLRHFSWVGLSLYLLSITERGQNRLLTHVSGCRRWQVMFTVTTDTSQGKSILKLTASDLLLEERGNAAWSLDQDKGQDLFRLLKWVRKICVCVLHLLDSLTCEHILPACTHTHLFTIRNQRLAAERKENSLNSATHAGPLNRQGGAREVRWGGWWWETGRESKDVEKRWRKAMKREKERRWRTLSRGPPNEVDRRSVEQKSSLGAMGWARKRRVKKWQSTRERTEQDYVWRRCEMGSGVWSLSEIITHAQKQLKFVLTNSSNCNPSSQ